MSKSSKTKDIEFHIEDTRHGALTCTYEFEIWRSKDTHQGRTQWIPRWTNGLIDAYLINEEGDEWEWRFGSGEDMPRELKNALKEHDGELADLIESKMNEIVNDPHFEGNHDADPAD